jgi:hypothetical protein
MRSRLTAALAVFAIGLAPSLAMAEDVQDQLRQMQDRLQNMEDKLQATNDQLGAANSRVEEQAALIESSGLAETRGASSGLGCLVCDWRIGGWVAGSYNYNLNDPNDAVPGGLEDTNLGDGGLFYDALHPDHNTFAVDQLWFEIEKEVSEESRAGFRADILYGKTAEQLNGLSNSGIFDFYSDSGRSVFDDATSLYVHQAYVQYAPPIGPEGTVMKFGKFATLIGAEVPGTIYNYNITRGQLWNLLQPIDHIGVLAGGTVGDSGFNWAVGGVNGFAPDSPDINDRKSVTGSLGWANDMFSVGVSGIWGGENLGFDGDESGLVGLLAKWTPSDRFGMYVDANFGWMDEPQGTNLDPYGWGVALAGRYGITERTGIALRGEYVTDEDGFILCGGRSGGLRFSDSGCFFTNSSSSQELDYVVSVTGTLDHLLTDNLMVRAEARWDKLDLDSGPTDIFAENNDFYTQDDQITLFFEVVYNFNKFIGD